MADSTARRFPADGTGYGSIFVFDIADSALDHAAFIRLQ